jgi:hypothetical protein
MTFSRLRWWVAACGLVAMWACNDRKVQTPTPQPTGTTQNYFEQNLNNKLDILFMVDDSTSMTTVQQNLVANFPVFINVLKSLPSGLPDVHIAVTTSNMGAGAFTSSVPGCTAPDLGQFISAPRASTDPICTTARITDGKSFIEASMNGAVKNFSGDITQVFSCIAQVGVAGCGFEHQLASVRAALGDPQMNLTPPTTNMGFLRDDAFLAIIWITNEDDCSARPDSQLFDPNQTTVMDPLGPLASYRCTEFGILCNGQRPPRAAGGPFTNCVSDDALAMSDPLKSLLPVQFFIDYFHRLKGGAAKVIAAAIAAPTDPFAVVLDTNMYPALQHSCAQADGTFGDPGVRMKQVIDSFGDLGTFTSICQASYADSMRVIAEKIGRSLGRQCINAVLAQAPGFTTALPTVAAGTYVDPTTVSCTVEDVQFIGTPQQKQLRSLPPCNRSGEPASVQCWAMVGDPMCSCDPGIDPCPEAKVLVCRNGFNPGDPAKPCPDGSTTVEDGVTAVVNCATLAQ